MRVFEPTSRSGFFWQPEAPDDKLPGTLTVSNGGQIELEVLGRFGPSCASIFEDAPLSRIVGVVEGGDAVTLDRCIELGRKSSAGGIVKTRIFSHLLILGLIYGSEEALIFERFQFSLDGFHDWLCWSGINLSFDFEAKSAIVKYLPQEEFSFELVPGICGAIGFSYSVSGAPIDGEVKLSEQAVFSLIPNEPVGIEVLSKIAHRLTHFFCLAIDQTVTINSVRARSPLAQLDSRNGDEESGPWVTIIYQSLPFSEQVPKLMKHSMLFRFPQIRDTASETFGNWLNAYELLHPALDLYFSVRTGAHQFINGRFLSLVQAIETLHRRTSDETVFELKEYDRRVEKIMNACPSESLKWLDTRLSYGNELSLANRIKRMVEPFASFFGSGKQTKSLIRKIVEWRNYLTHYDAKSEKLADDTDELFPLCMKMEALLQLHWLKMIGFSENAIEATVRGSNSLQNKLSRPEATRTECD